MHWIFKRSTALVALVLLALSVVASPVASAAEAGSFSSKVAWKWVHSPLPSASSRDHFVEVDMTGNVTVMRNGAMVVRRQSAGDYALVSFSGTRYQVRVYRAGRQSLLIDKPFVVGRGGTARTEIRGSTLTTTWNGALVSSDTRSALGALAGTGTGLAVWQDRAHAVSLTAATSGALAAPLSQPGRWLSGASGDGVATGSFGNWRGRAVDIAGTWNNNWESQPWQWSLRPGFEYGSWQGDLDMAVGAIFKDRGESWTAAAQGRYDERWRLALVNLVRAWDDRPGTLYIRFAHEFNGDWSDASVHASEVEDFRRAWTRFRALQLEIAPRHKLVFCPNNESSASLALDWRRAFPGHEHVDVMAVDIYNQYPFVRTADEFASESLRYDSWGAPRGLERHRQFAAAVGRPFAIPEWSSNADFGDSPVFVDELHEWLGKNGGSGPGQVLYEIQFNVGNYGDGKYQLFPSSRQPRAATAYAQSW